MITCYYKNKLFAISLFFLLMNCLPVFASKAQERIDKDVDVNKPVVIQASVALADNKHQWIVPVPKGIGNGQDARTNLYWGARYGLKTFLIKDCSWKKISSVKPLDKRILERLILKKNFLRKGRMITVYLIADAWNGKNISDTIRQFMNYNAGNDVINVKVEGKNISAGGGAHLVVYIGHNALMDYGGMRKNFTNWDAPAKNNPDNDAIVLACKSRQYFSKHLEKIKAHPLVMTTGLMAPEAYSLNDAIQQWIKGSDDITIRKAAAAAYNKYQKTGRKGAERLFGVTR